MKTYNYYQPGASLSGCPGTAMEGGWYAEGSSTPIASSYINPTTGQPYTPAELGGGTTPTPTPTTPTGGTPAGTAVPGMVSPEATEAPSYDVETGIYVNPQYGFEGTMEEWNAFIGREEGKVLPTTHEGAVTPTTPAFGAGAAAGIPLVEVTPAPPYEISPEQQEMMDLYGGILTDWVTNPQGIPPETQAQMIQLQTDTLKAREQEAIRVMTNNMERRGITNSGYLQANTNMITSNTSVAIAGAIADVQIKSALMKMASFEKGMGQMAQFLGFLSEQSQLAYAPEFATWQAEQMATMQHWQAKMDVYKMELNQAYQTQNIILQGEIQSQLNTEQNEFNLLLAEMEIEANNKIAMAQGIGGLFGTVLTLIFGK